MMKQNSEFRAEAREALGGNWGVSALYYFVASLVIGIGGTAIGYVVPGGSTLVSIILLPVAFGATIGFLRQFRGQELELGWLFKFFNRRVWCTLILKFIYTMLWTLLLVIPGIIKSYSYAMTEYLLEDDPELENNAAIEKSMAMMEGHKMELFLLDLSFIGWALLSILTLGIGLFWVVPYQYTAHCAFYEQLKKEYEGQC